MRLLHLADLHLDRAFGGLAFTGCDASRRRGLLRQALEWAVDTAEAEKAGALTIAGDLFELEHVTADTVAFMTRQFSRLSCPVVISSGNHDPAAAASPYRVAKWPANVVLCLDARPTTVDLGEAILVGLGYTGKDMDISVLERLPARGKEERPRLLMVHGVDLDSISTDFLWGGLGLRAADLGRYGFDHALMGHVHAGRAGEHLSWPGSPVPLDPGETAGVHGALWINVAGGKVTATAVPANLARFETVSVDATEIADSSELATAVGSVLEPLLGSPSLVTCRLWGRHDKSLAIDAEGLSTRWADSVLGLSVVDATVSEVDLQELAREPTARGAAVSRLLNDGSAAALWSAQLVAEAFEGDLRLPA